MLGQAAHQLAGHVPVRGLVEFAVVFAQMGILVPLAVFTADAVGGGWGFAVVYATYQVFQTWLWSAVWRQDRRDHRAFLPTTAGYVVGITLAARASRAALA